jgi:negative regulator of flagellin synthesis FlgM
MKINPNIAAGSSGIQSSDTKKLEKAKVSGYENKSDASTAPLKSDSANTEISSKAKDMAKAKQVASDAPDVREAKIAALKEQIQNKKYNVSAEAIADKLVDDHIRLAGA